MLSLAKKNIDYRILLALLFVFATGLRFYGLSDKSLWADEITSYIIARQGFLTDLQFSLQDVTPPLHYFLATISIHIHDSVFFFRLPSAISGSLSCLLIFFLTNKLFSRRVALASALLLTCSPFHLQYSQDGRMYSLMMFLALGACWTQLEYLERTLSFKCKAFLGWYIGWVIFTILGLYNSYFSLFLFCGQGFYLIFHLSVNLRCRKISTWIEHFWFFLYPFLAFAPLIGKLIKLFSQQITNASCIKLNLMPISLEFLHRFGPNQVVFNYIFLLFFFSGLVLTHRKAFYFLFMFLPPFCFLSMISTKHFFALRYISHLLPLYLIYITAGLEIMIDHIFRYFRIHKKIFSKLFFFLITMALFLSTLPQIQFYYKNEKQNWRDAAKFLQSRIKPHDVLVPDTIGANFCLHHYWSKLDWSKFGTVKYNVSPRVREVEQLLELQKRYLRVWYVCSWKNHAPPDLIAHVEKYFLLEKHFPALTNWGEIYIYSYEGKPTSIKGF